MKEILVLYNVWSCNLLWLLEKPGLKSINYTAVDHGKKECPKQTNINRLKICNNVSVPAEPACGVITM